MPARQHRSALDVLGVERVDHGVAVMEDPRWCPHGRRAIPLTVCPNSNVVIANRFPSLEAHPFRADARGRPPRDDQHR